MNALGRYLRFRVSELGSSLSELSRRTGLSRQTIHALSQEDGRLPELETVVRLAVELGVHPLQLLHLVFEDYTLPLRQTRQHSLRGDRSVFVADVTIPDGTLVTPGARFTKVWEVQNVGTVPWIGRVLRCIDDSLEVRTVDPLGAVSAAGTELAPRVAERLQPDASEIAVPDTAPGQIVRMSVDFKAPTVPGTCISYWKSFFNDGGLCFPDSVGLSCKVRVISMTSKEIGVLM